MNKLSECIINKNSSYKPVWFMRQAGRYLSEFREIRKNNQNFIKLCLNTKLTTEITLQPLIGLIWMRPLFFLISL